MKATPVPLTEITTQAIRILCREMGPVKTARFLNQVGVGFGNYTEERDKILGNPTVDELAAEIKKWKATRSRPRKTARKKKPRG